MQPTQGQGPWSSADYRNGSDIESDIYTAAREAEHPTLANNRTALNAANVTAARVRQLRSQLPDFI
jgi:hypothetical protein